MAIIKYQSPFGALNSLRQEMNKIFDPSYYDTSDISQSLGTNWSPNVDVKEDADKFVVFADVPGMEAKDIKVSMDNNMLTISGERKLEAEHKSSNYHRTERFTGSFYRQFSLPQNIDSAKIKAKSKKGVLEITIPKIEREKTKYVEITSED